MFWNYCDAGNGGAVHYGNAGRCPPMLIGARNGKLGIKRLDVGGPVLGLLPEANYVQGHIELRPGDVMVLYSDGLAEATNAAG
jgi:sigma-B regulation protein RsbU (phosphoserine phosphatase)